MRSRFPTLDVMVDEYIRFLARMSDCPDHEFTAQEKERIKRELAAGHIPDAQELIVSTLEKQKNGRH